MNDVKPEGKTALELIGAERARQIAAEGWTLEHDKQHRNGELALLAAAYATPDEDRDGFMANNEWLKPTPHDRIRELVKAGALIIAEIERLSPPPQPTPADSTTDKIARALRDVVEECKAEGSLDYSGCIMQDATIALAEYDAKQQGAVLWCMHIQGPDDVHPAPSKAHAEKAAQLFNARFGSVTDVLCKAVVEPWPHSAESHAEDVANFCANWFAPSQPPDVRGEVLFDLVWRIRKFDKQRMRAALAAASKGEGHD